MNSTLRSLVFWMVLVVVVVLIWNVSTQFQAADDSVTFSDFPPASGCRRSPERGARRQRDYRLNGRG